MLCAGWLLVVVGAWGVARAAPAACDRSRALLRGPRGRFTAGPPGANYTHDSHCQWLIQSKKPPPPLASFLSKKQSGKMKFPRSKFEDKK